MATGVAVDWSAKLGLCGLSSEALFDHIRGAIKLGSVSNHLSWDDFSFAVNSTATTPDNATVDHLIEHGMAPLDAVVWCEGSSRPVDLRIQVRGVDDNVVVAHVDLVRGLFAWYFSLFTQGRAIAQGPSNFLVNVMGFGDDFANYINALTTADIDNFPTKWVREVDLSGLSEKARNRLALGAAGHRYVSALPYIREEDWDPTSADNKAYAQSVLRWVQGRAWWDLHPLFKSGAIITAAGSLNKCIEDCLATGLTAAGKSRLVNARVLHHDPIAQPAHEKWRSSGTNAYPALTSRIFP